MSGTPIVQSELQWKRQTEKRLGWLERRPGVGAYWDHSTTDGFVRSASTTTETGPAGPGWADWTYTSVQVALTPGVWRVYGSASTVNMAATDDFAIGLWDMGTGAIVPNSIGTAQQSGLTLRGHGDTQPIMVRVDTSATYRLRIIRNGGSQVRVSSTAGAPAAWLQAERVQ